MQIGLLRQASLLQTALETVNRSDLQLMHASSSAARFLSSLRTLRFEGAPLSRSEGHTLLSLLPSVSLSELSFGAPPAALRHFQQFVVPRLYPDLSCMLFPAIASRLELRLQEKW